MSQARHINNEQPEEREGSRSGPTPARPGVLSGFRLGTLGGVEIRVDWSLLIIFVLILFNLGAGVLPAWHPEWSAWLTWSVALAASVLFFASVLVHELSHAWVGRSQGIPVSHITLFIFGGLAHMGGEPKSPKAEFWMTIVGPITSIAIGVVATLAGSLLGGESLLAASQNPEAMLAGVAPLPTLLLWLGPINLLLGVFNLIPGFPLDGGRVLRSVLWAITKNFEKATRWASGVGRGVAWVLMGIGIVQAFGGLLLQGLWLLLIGWFLNNAARASYQQLVVRHALEDLPVTRVMRTRLVRVAPESSVEFVVFNVFFASDQETVPVEADGQLVGLVSLADVRTIPQSRWSDATVSEIMKPVDSADTLPPDAGAEQALRQLGNRNREQLPVVDGGRVLGLVAMRDLLRWVSLREGIAFRASEARS